MRRCAGVPDIVVRNIIGSSIFNALDILGATALIAPVPVTGWFLTFDLPVKMAAPGV